MPISVREPVTTESAVVPGLVRLTAPAAAPERWRDPVGECRRVAASRDYFPQNPSGPKRTTFTLTMRSPSVRIVARAHRVSEQTMVSAATSPEQ